MPELPDITLYIEALRARILGRRLERTRVLSPFLLRSVDPPITVPAWSCMVSGRDPGELGIYGFRNRRDHSYDGLGIADEPEWTQR